jgi:transglutaminase-like putative cysteine protease
MRVVEPVGSQPLSPAAKAALGLEVATTYVRARRNLRRAGLRQTLAELRAAEPHVEASADDPVAIGRRLGQIVTRTLRALPADGRCLSQSLVLTRLLAARGVESQLVIAVQPGEEFAAHAWVEHDGVALLPRGTERFEELVTL